MKTPDGQWKSTTTV